MKYKITILVTVYNAKKYLKICADSLVNQTCDKKLFEVIFVDDGSTDGSGELCDFYSDKYENFRTIHQKNSGGPSLGRNKGIDNANSDFIYFCDVDDYFNEESVERLIKYIDKWDSDIILTKLNTDTNRDIPRNIFDENYEFVDPYESCIFRALGPYKVFKIKFLKDNNIYFKEDVCYEDLIFCTKAYLLANKISILSDYDYYVCNIRDDGTNLTSNKSKNSKNFWKYQKRIISFEILLDTYNKYSDKTKNQKEIILRFMNNLYEIVRLACVSYHTKDDEEKINFFVKTIFNENYALDLSQRRYLFFKYYIASQNISKTSKFYYQLINNEVTTFKGKNKFYINFDNVKIDISDYVKENLSFKSTLYDIKINGSKITMYFNLYTFISKKFELNIKSKIDGLYTKILKIKLVRTENEICKVVKMDNIYLLYDKYTFKIDINLSDFSKIDLADNEITLQMFIKDSNNKQLKIKNKTEKFFNFAYAKNNLIIIPDTEKGNYICFRMLNDKADLTKLNYIGNKKRPIKNRIIFTLLNDNNYKIAYEVASDIFNDTLKTKFTLNKKYIKYYHNKSIIKIKNSMYRNPINVVFNKLKCICSKNG